MPVFVLNRTYVLASNGHMLRFEKGQPTSVPPECVKAVVAIGAECVDGPVDVLPPEEVPEPHLTPADKQELMNKAFEKLIARNDRDDFEGSGKPNAAVLKEIVKFSFTKKERDAFYQVFRESKVTV